MLFILCMKDVIVVRNRSIQCELEPHVVRIFVDDALNALLAKDTESTTAELVTAIKTQYGLRYEAAFEVSDTSMMIEIWGHVYAEKVAEAIKDISPIDWIDSFADKVIQRSERIDIGEKGHDTNRFFWDSLCHFKTWIVSFLPSA